MTSSMLKSLYIERRGWILEFISSCRSVSDKLKGHFLESAVSAISTEFLFELPTSRNRHPQIE